MRHGWYGTYTNHSCRCTACREAWSRHMIEYRGKPTNTKRLTHGSDSSYGAGCRCEECKKAHRSRNRGGVKQETGK